jgi:hypothetical protein
LVLDLLTGPLVPSTYDNLGTGIRRFIFFCDKEGITPLQATAADMPGLAALITHSRTVAASILQP